MDEVQNSSADEKNNMNHPKGWLPPKHHGSWGVNASMF
jgi:hypothetical protein